VITDHAAAMRLWQHAEGVGLSLGPEFTFKTTALAKIFALRQDAGVARAGQAVEERRKQCHTVGALRIGFVD